MHFAIPLFATALLAGSTLATTNAELEERNNWHQDYRRQSITKGVAPTTTGTGVWQSTASATTIVITTASVNHACGAQFGTRTVCATPHAKCTSARQSAGKTISTCKAASATTSTRAASTSTKAASSTAKSTSKTSTAAATATGGPSGAIADILTAHNNARKTHGANPLVWSDSLAAEAKTWANKCVWEHGGTSGGQNLYASASSANTGGSSGQAAVDSWMSEEADYDPSNPTYSHFTQVVWKSSTQLGCYEATCGTNFVDSTGASVFSGYPYKYYIVCNYNPAGNVIGQFAQNVQKNS